MKKSNKRKKTCRCKTIKGIGQAHTYNCVFGKRKKTVKTIKAWAVMNARKSIKENVPEQKELISAYDAVIEDWENFDYSL